MYNTHRRSRREVTYTRCNFNLTTIKVDKLEARASKSAGSYALVNFPYSTEARFVPVARK